MVTEKPCNLLDSEWNCQEIEEVELVEPVQMNMYQSNTYREDVSWLNFDDEPTVPESGK